MTKSGDCGELRIEISKLEGKIAKSLMDLELLYRHCEQPVMDAPVGPILAASMYLVRLIARQRVAVLGEASEHETMTDLHEKMARLFTEEHDFIEQRLTRRSLN
jgi:hypothetical protein